MIDLKQSYLLHKTVFILYFALINVISCAQNLVPNYSFEDTVSCPTWGYQIHLAPPWKQPTMGTCDLFHTCTEVANQVSIPLNFAGDQYPRTGEAYAGIYPFADLMEDYREYLQVELKQTLKAGKSYCVSFYANLGDSSNLTTSSVGVYFSADSIGSSDYHTLLYQPQVENPEHVFFNHEDWTLVKGIFFATGVERYMTIGNFRKTNETITKVPNPPNLYGPGIYLYIDDVSVEECSIELPNIFTPNNDGVNDVWVFNGFDNASEFNCKVYDRWGSLMFESNDVRNSWTGKNNKDEMTSDGVYYYVIKAIYNNGFVFNKAGLCI
ncbi:MAG TPA: gliding motility-associated C-terminal domain-containing protein [Flavobacteriales bacterium]|nr:gliding motility-associated C-terminal domain-containing protein [Flavobacteriales bacterium]